MSEPENFLERWSRRKREAEERAPADATAPDKPEDEADPSDLLAQMKDAVSPAVDLASLPPIESITAASDIRAFLMPGVPAELTRAALRRAWTADPAIRDFIGIAENQWDFTKPDGVPGFGPLELTAEVRRMVARLIGEEPPASPPGEPIERPHPAETFEESSPPPASIAAASEGADAGMVLPPAVEADAALASADDPSLLHHAALQDNSAHDTPEEADAGRDPTPRKHGGALPKVWAPHRLRLLTAVSVGA